jgi:hypothetical protein
MTWQPIETAPKDGTRILGTQGRYVALFRWRTVDEAQRRDYVKDGWRDENGWFADNLTHWMPLPDPPAARRIADERKAVAS